MISNNIPIISNISFGILWDSCGIVAFACICKYLPLYDTDIPSFAFDITNSCIPVAKYFAKPPKENVSRYGAYIKSIN